MFCMNDLYIKNEQTYPTIYVPLVNTSRSFPHSRIITGFVTRLTRRVPLVEQELLTLPDHLSSPPVFSGVRVNQSLVLYVRFVDLCLSFCTYFNLLSLNHVIIDKAKDVLLRHRGPQTILAILARLLDCLAPKYF